MSGLGPIGKLPSPRSNSLFAQVPQVQIPRSRFDRSHKGKTTLDASNLVPILVDEVLPGDTFNLQATLFARLSTPIKPVMDNMWMQTFFFFVPSRLLWTNWEKFNGAQTNPGDSTSYTLPGLTGPFSFTEQTIFDYMGLPMNVNMGTTTVGLINALPFRAYNRIYNDWFRDENLTNSVAVNTGDGPDASTDYSVKIATKPHDYFTSCLPWPQKPTAQTIPLSGSAEVKYNDNTAVGKIRVSAAGRAAIGVGALASAAGGNFQDNPFTATLIYDPNTTLYADLSTATNSTINALRQAVQLQRFYERDARGGTRYTEIILSHFGVVSPDFRLQRPEYLGGGRTPINFTPVPQTTATGLTGGSTAQGNLAAFATGLSEPHGFTKSFTEHGYVIGLVCIRGELTYQQGINRLWSRRTRADFYWPSLAHLGEQAVLNKEIYYDGTAASDNVFGYQERYAEYRYKPSWIAGKFKSYAAGTLDIWHLAQHFTSGPVLNDTFITDNLRVTLDRNIATPSEPQFLLDMYFRYFCARPMPVRAIPGMMDRF